MLDNRDPLSTNAPAGSAPPAAEPPSWLDHLLATRARCLSMDDQSDRDRLAFLLNDEFPREAMRVRIAKTIESDMLASGRFTVDEALVFATRWARDVALAAEAVLGLPVRKDAP